MPVAKEVVDAQLAQLQSFHHLFTKKEVAYLPEVLREGEVVRALVSGFYDGGTWLVVATTQRVLFLDKGVFGGLRVLDLPLTKIQGTSHSIGIMVGTVSITTGGATWKVDHIVKNETQRFAEALSLEVERARHGGGAPPAAPAGHEDFISRLERLGALRDRGVLTPMEFEEQKRRILSDAAR